MLIRTPEGTSLASTTQIAEDVAKQIRALPGVESTLMTDGGGADASVNNASIYVKLTDIDKRRPFPNRHYAAHPCIAPHLPPEHSYRR